MRKITLDVYNDPGHGWAKTPLRLLRQLGIANKITEYSYMRGDYAYLEEDCDLSLLIDAAEKEGLTIKFRDHTADKQSKIRGYEPYVLQP